MSRSEAQIANQKYSWTMFCLKGMVKALQRIRLDTTTPAVDFILEQAQQSITQAIILLRNSHKPPRRG